MDTIIDLVFLALVFWLGWTLRGLAFLNRLAARPQYFKRLIDELIKAQEEAQAKEGSRAAQPEESRAVTQEWHGSQVYLWCNRTGQFLGQGPTLQAALEQARARFPHESLELVRAANSSESSQPDCKS